MGILNYIIWNASPEIFSIASFSVRWYGLFFALGFLISQQILYYMYRREGKPEKDVDTLTIYMVIATIVGARLGHVLFYDTQMIWENPLDIILPFEFSPFRFKGYQGLASHGAAIGILFALWLYSRKNKPGQSYLRVVDRIVILVALTGALIRFGNYFNGEIIGKPTDKPWGVVFTGKLTEAFDNTKRIDQDDIVEDVVYIKNDSLERKENGRVPILIYVFFKHTATEAQIEALLQAQIRPLMLDQLVEFFDDTHHLNMEYATAKPEGGGFVAKIKTYGVARHPAQLYESIACVLLFILLLLIWMKYKENLPPGRLLGIFLIWCFGLRFMFEFLKENQASFEAGLPINMGQILSIPLVIAGIVILIMSFRKKEA